VEANRALIFVSDKPASMSLYKLASTFAGILGMVVVVGVVGVVGVEGTNAGALADNVDDPG
jgi:hypothetical protein